MAAAAWKVPLGCFGDAGERPDISKLAPTQLNLELTSSDPEAKLKTVKLRTNNFRLVLGDTRSIQHYHYTIEPPSDDESVHRQVLQHFADRLRKDFGAFVWRCPKHLFSPCKIRSAAIFTAQVGLTARTLTVTLHEAITSEKVNYGLVGEAEVVFRYIIKNLFKLELQHQIGRRFFGNPESASGLDHVFPGYIAALGTLGGIGARLTLDTTFRVLQPKCVLDTVARAIEFNDALALDDPFVRAVWLERCIGATVVTPYNPRGLYKIRRVHFEMTPGDKFEQRLRDQKQIVTMTFASYLLNFYQCTVKEMRQPMLEAYPERRHETVFLVPELCMLTGTNDENRKDKEKAKQETTALRLRAEAAKIGPQDRYEAVHKLMDKMRGSIASASTKQSKLMEEWGLSVAEQSVEVEGRQFNPLEVSFEDNKPYPIEDGSFQRWMRNGLVCPAVLSNWLFIYPETDSPVVSMWLRSVKDMAEVAFHITMHDPVKIVCTDQRKDLSGILAKYVQPSTQLVLLLTPQKDSRAVYKKFKYETCTKLAVVTQVVKSECIRKRTSIATILSRIVVQINTKVAGPVWHVDVKPFTEPFFSEPTMAIGIEIFKAPSGKRFLGFTASLNNVASEYYSVGCQLDKNRELEHICAKLQEYFRDACLHFLGRHDNLAPSHVLIYRGSVYPEEWVALCENEVRCFETVIKAFPCEDYNPTLTYVAVAKQPQTRFFQVTKEGVKNPDVGTVVDAPAVCSKSVPSFFLVNHAVTKGTAVPAHFAVLRSSSLISMEAIQHVTHRLAFMYFNCPGPVRLPAPLQYARKLARFIGTVFTDEAGDVEPHPRLRRSFYYL